VEIAVNAYRQWLTNPAAAADAKTMCAHILAALDAALSAASTPAPGGVPVRVAVAVDKRGIPEAAAAWINDLEPTWEHLASLGYQHRAAILTATIPIPVTPTIPVTGSAVGEE